MKKNKTKQKQKQKRKRNKTYYNKTEPATFGTSDSRQLRKYQISSTSITLSWVVMLRSVIFFLIMRDAYIREIETKVHSYFYPPDTILIQALIKIDAENQRQEQVVTVGLSMSAVCLIEDADALTMQGIGGFSLEKENFKSHQICISVSTIN